MKNVIQKEQAAFLPSLQILVELVSSLKLIDHIKLHDTLSVFAVHSPC